MDNYEDEHLVNLLNDTSIPHSDRSDSIINFLETHELNEFCIDAIFKYTLDNNDTEVLTELLKYVDVNYKESNTSETLLHKTIINNKPDLVEILLHNGADKNLPNGKGKMPIDLAYENNNTDIIRLLEREITVLKGGKKRKSRKYRKIKEI